MKTISAKEARANFSDVLNEVHFSRKKVLITRSGKPQVVLISFKEYQDLNVKGSKER